MVASEWPWLGGALDSQCAVAHGNLGLSLAQTGQPQEALVHFREAVRLEPMFTTAHENLANLWLAMGNTNAAIQQYRDALTASPDWTEGRQRLAELSR